MGRTRPRRVTSPVIPTTPRAGTPSSRLTSAAVMVTPADGPSFGTAPAGTWTWNRLPANAAGSMPNSWACDRTNVSAISADSFMMSPRCPVRVRPPRHRCAVGGLEEEPGPPEPTPDVVALDRDRTLGLAGNQLGRHLSHQPPELALQGPHAGLARVVRHHGRERVVGDDDL